MGPLTWRLLQQVGTSGSNERLPRLVATAACPSKRRMGLLLDLNARCRLLMSCVVHVRYAIALSAMCSRLRCWQLRGHVEGCPPHFFRPVVLC